MRQYLISEIKEPKSEEDFLRDCSTKLQANMDTERKVKVIAKACKHVIRSKDFRAGSKLKVLKLMNKLILNNK